jgi:predicted Ser/Thr protein kinase
VDLVDVDGRQVILKDLSERPWFVRRCLGPWQLDREARAYRILEGIPGIPRCLGRPTREMLALEYIPGRTLRSTRPGELDSSFFDRLEALLNAAHHSGVAHGDLHHRDVIAGPGDVPYLIDFSTSLIAGRGAGRLRRAVFTWMCRADLRSVAKLRRRLNPGSSTEVPPASAPHALGHILKRLLGRGGRPRTPR